MPSSLRAKRIQFTIAFTLIALIWGVLLPWVGAQPLLRLKIEKQNAQGIDPTALYYTDLKVMEKVDAKLDDVRKNHPTVFWRPTTNQAATNLHEKTD